MLEPRLRAFLLSLGLHVAGVALLVEASHHGWLEVQPAAPYRDRIRPERRRIIWYTKAADLPSVSPVDTAAPDRAKRPSVRAPQKVQANAPRPESRRQMILQSPPEIRLPADLTLPNLLAWNPTPPPEPRRRFQLAAPVARRPEPKPLDTPAPELALKPSAGPNMPMEVPQLPPRPRFQLPERAPRPAVAPQALDTPVPEVALSPVAAPKLPVQPAQLPERPRFQVPERARRGPIGPLPVTAGEAPQVALAPAELAGQPSTVIVGLDPTPGPLPPPPGNRSAEFSTGPDAGENGSGNGSTPAQTAELRVPHLSIAPAPAAALAGPRLPAADRAAFRRQLLSAAPVTRTALSTVLPEADPYLHGSTVYTMAVDMPNITSYEGSWTVRFTELGGSSPDDTLTAPAALRKVDPKYIASAAAEGVQGKVLLYAVIRRDGRVDQVRLVQGIDERLDSSAMAAFSKWEFQPATRNGVSIDVEAVVQIPFRLHKAGVRP